VGENNNFLVGGVGGFAGMGGFVGGTRAGIGGGIGKFGGIDGAVGGGTGKFGGISGGIRKVDVKPFIGINERINVGFQVK